MYAQRLLLQIWSKAQSCWPTLKINLSQKNWSAAQLYKGGMAIWNVALNISTGAKVLNITAPQSSYSGQCTVCRTTLYTRHAVLHVVVTYVCMPVASGRRHGARVHAGRPAHGQGAAGDKAIHTS